MSQLIFDTKSNAASATTEENYSIIGRQVFLSIARPLPAFDAGSGTTRVFFNVFSGDGKVSIAKRIGFDTSGQKNVNEFVIRSMIGQNDVDNMVLDASSLPYKSPKYWSMKFDEQQVTFLTRAAGKSWAQIATLDYPSGSDFSKECGFGIGFWRESGDLSTTPLIVNRFRGALV